MRPPISIAAAVLHLLAADDEQLTTKELCSQLEGLTAGYEPSAKVVNQAISTLQRAGLAAEVRGTSQDGSPGQRGRPARSWSITEDGRKKAIQYRQEVAVFFGLKCDDVV